MVIIVACHNSYVICGVGAEREAHHLYLLKRMNECCQLVLTKSEGNIVNVVIPAPHSGAKTITQWIGNGKGGSMSLKFTVFPNGTVMIYLQCSDNPFRLKFEDDVSTIMTFLGRIEERLHNLLSDRRGIIVSPVNKWILKNCDVNKDIEIDPVTQLSFTDMQMPLVEKALRVYVKVIGDKAYLRVEKYLSPDKPIEEALENIRTTVDLDKDFSETE